MGTRNRESIHSMLKTTRKDAHTDAQVFKIYWSEPMGASGALSVSSKQMFTGDFGSFYTGFRRFIVVATDEGHSTCVYVFCTFTFAPPTDKWQASCYLWRKGLQEARRQGIEARCHIRVRNEDSVG